MLKKILMLKFNVVVKFHFHPRKEYCDIFFMSIAHDNITAIFYHFYVYFVFSRIL
jgi:hypothetical protein